MYKKLQEFLKILPPEYTYYYYKAKLKLAEFKFKEAKKLAVKASIEYQDFLRDNPSSKEERKDYIITDGMIYCLLSDVYDAENKFRILKKNVKFAEHEPNYLMLTLDIISFAFFMNVSKQNIGLKKHMNLIKVTFMII